VSGAANLLKLERRRIDAFIDVDLTVLHMDEHGQLPFKLRIDPLWAPPSPVHCAFNPKFAAAHPRLMPSLEAMVRDGRVQVWIDAYTGGRRVTQPQ